MSYEKYFRDVKHLDKIDIYRFLDLFEVTDHALGHAIKKLVLSGARTGKKPLVVDVTEARDTLNRWLEMLQEDDGWNDETIKSAAFNNENWIDYDGNGRPTNRHARVDLKHEDGSVLMNEKAGNTNWLDENITHWKPSENNPRIDLEY